MKEFEKAEREMREKGIKLDKLDAFIDQKNGPIMWLDALCLFWWRNHRLPSPHVLAAEMFDEWDDPVSIDEAQRVLEAIA